MAATMAARKAAKARDTLNAYRRLFSTEDGQTVLRDLMKTCHFFSPTTGPTPHDTYLNEGARGTVLRILQTAQLNETQIDTLAQSILDTGMGEYLE